MVHWQSLAAGRRIPSSEQRFMTTFVKTPVNGSDCAQPLLYPLLGSLKDLGFVRLSGNGLGNSFYSYFHAFVLAERNNGRLIRPAWFSLKTGPLRRGDASKRLYLGLFRPMPDEISGFTKYASLVRVLSSPNLITIGDTEIPRLDASKLNVVSCQGFTFRGLHEHRDAIRNRLLTMIRQSPPPGFGWGSLDHIAIHVRLGDFVATTDISTINSGTANRRVPMSWYVAIIKRIRKQSSSRPILLVSDGNETELLELINAGAQLVRSGSDMGDLLTLSSASLLIGSNSTFSRWAAFLGDMPAIWTSRPKSSEMPSLDESKMLYVPIGTETSFVLPSV